MAGSFHSLLVPKELVVEAEVVVEEVAEVVQVNSHKIKRIVKSMS